MFSVPAFADINWSGQILAGVEKMDYGTDTTPSDKVSDELQFSNIKLNLNVKADVCDKVAGVAELRAVCDKAEVTKRCVYAEITDLIIPDGSIKIGRVELPLGAEAARASKGANTMRNPLIFNSILADDMIAQFIDDGLLISKTLGPVTCKLGITNGYDGNKDTNRDKAITVNLSGDCPGVAGLSLAGTYYTNDAADQSGETDETTKWIADVAYKVNLLKLAASVGNEKLKRGTETKTDYLVLEVAYGNGETPWWVGARYSTKKPTTTKPTPDPKDDEKRLELGAGYKLCKDAHLKIEYIDHKLKDDNAKASHEELLKDYKGIKAVVNINL